jgi:hypothetical protein
MSDCPHVISLTLMNRFELYLALMLYTKSHWVSYIYPTGHI